MKNLFSLRKILSTIALVAILSLPFIFNIYRVSGISMEPTLSAGNRLMVERVSHALFPLTREELLVFRNPHAPAQTDIKRIIGLPGETVEVKATSVDITHEDGITETFESATLIGGGANGRNGLFFKMKLGPEDYFLLGDNRESSDDSRMFGAVQRHDMVGRVLFSW